MAAGIMIINGKDTVYPGVTLNGKDISGMTLQEVTDAATELNIAANVTMPTGDEFTVTAAEVGISSAPDEIAALAIKQGRRDNVFSNALSYLRASSSPVEIAELLKAELDTEAVKAAVTPYVDEYNTAVGGAPYEINGDKLTVKKGAGQMGTTADIIATLVADTLNTSFESGEPVNAVFTLGELKALSIQEIYNSVHVEPSNAVYDPATDSIKASVTGISFDIAAAQSVYESAEMGDTISIDLILTEPEIVAEKPEDLLFRDLLYSCDTNLTYSYNRTNNVKLAAEAINGYILKPGETFSFNGVVGERTTEKGYLEGISYIGGKSVPDVGGGICQVSSSLYCCAVYSDLEIVDRSNHMFPVSYLPLGIDATVNWGTCDFQFKNDQNFPIKIEAYVDEDAYKLIVNFYGTKLDDRYAKTDYTIAAVYDYEVIEKEDPSIPEGETKVEEYGSVGYLVYTYRYWYNSNDELIEEEFLATSDYSPCDEIILIPVKKAETPPETQDPTAPPSGEESGGESEAPGESAGSESGESGSEEAGGGESDGGESDGGESGGETPEG